MKCLHLFRVLNSSPRICYSRQIQTDVVMLARTRSRKVPRKISYEPGLRHTEAALNENSDVLEDIQNEEDLENSTEVMNFNEEYDMDVLNEKKRRQRLGFIITGRKFFKKPPEPSTLSCNERECIRYLHNTDPVQWNVKTLSEGFPATPEAITKVLKGKYSPSEEKKKIMDLNVQKNWELLAEGKLKAEPHVLEHLKKFINRREVLLDQIKKANFYLPEVKEQVVWNRGEMSNILDHYEKAIKKLAHKKQELQSGDTSSNKSLTSASKIRKQMRITPENEKQEKLMLQDVKKNYNLPDIRTEFVFPDELKKFLCETGTSTEASSSSEKELARESGTEGFGKKNSFSDAERFKGLKVKYTERLNAHKRKNYANQVKDLEDSASWNKGRRGHEKVVEDTEESAKEIDFLDSNQVKDIENTASWNKGRTDHEKAVEDTEESAKKIDFSDAGRLRRENEYFANQVKDIENTAFWNKGRKSKEKALAENEKVLLGGPDTLARGKICSSDVYPERIKIPRDKHGSGLTFRVKDCYYDDDGEFLYRVPGMVK